DLELIYQALGFVYTDDESILSGNLARTAGEEVGNYAINIGTLDAGNNYTIAFTGADFAISKADITGITFDDDSFTYDGTSKSLSVSGVPPAGTTVSYTGNDQTDAGTYSVT